MAQKKIIIALLILTALIGTFFLTRSMIPVSSIKQLEVVDLVVGKGDLAMVGKRIKIHYTASVYQGQNFESTYGKEPYSFRLGNGEAIPGFEQGIPGMKVGGKRRLTMPPDMGFGVTGSHHHIPQNSALVYEVELIESHGN